MPSSSLKTRLKALETAQAVVDDSLYWAAVMEREPEFMRVFGQAIRHEISMSEWHAWLDEHPHPSGGRALTDQEQRQAEEAWREFKQKLAQTRERLLNSGIIIEAHNHTKESHHDNTGDETRERANQPAAEQPAPCATDPTGSQQAPRQHLPCDDNNVEPDGPTKAFIRKRARLERAENQ